MSALITLKNLMQYTPETPASAPESAFFLKTDEGADWYQALIHFAPDTLKVMYDSRSVIVDANNDAAKLWPWGLSVSEIEADAVPKDFTRPDQNSMGKWLYQDGKIVLAPIDLVQVATRRREKEMAAISTRITALMEAQDDGDITVEELAELAAQRERRTKFRRLDLSKAPDIDWPD
jgi:hypothetical protein